MSTAELFIEVRCEELPARFAEPAREGLVRVVSKILTGIDHGEVRSWGTPRRIAVAVSNVATERPVEEKLVTGPPEAAAFRDGVATPAAIGFAKSKGLQVEDLEVVDGPKGRVIAAKIRTGGEQTAERIATELEAGVMGIRFAKTMQWGNGGIRWARPIHSVVAKLGPDSIDLSIAGIHSGPTTLAHRLTPGPITVENADQWVQELRAAHVEPDVHVRRESIRTQLAERAASLGAETPAMPDLVEEVTHLVECPVVIAAEFDAELLELPTRLLVESMKVHQRVFPLFKGDALINQFLVVTNHPYALESEVAATIAKGNAKVLAARFHDAKFFYAEDQKASLAAHGQNLTDMRWIRGGGTMADKAVRIGELAERVASLVDADPAKSKAAGALSKADLATQMVGEFPELQGHVGHLLHVLAGEDKTVALALEEHYLPRFSGDELPTSAEGLAVALADRIDTLTGCFSLGLKPKGSADPLGLRRAAGGTLALIRNAGVRTTMSDLLSLSAFDAPDGSWAELEAFITARLRAQFQERWPTDLVDAVLATGDADPVALEARLTAMASLASSDNFGPIKTTFKRVMGLTKEHASTDYDFSALNEPAEQALHTALAAVSARAAELAEGLDYTGSLTALSTLREPVDTLFEAVMVMDKDETVRKNRLGLLRSVADQFARIADFTHLSSDA